MIANHQSDTFRARFPAVIYDSGRYRVVASLQVNKTVPDAIRFQVEGRTVDALGEPCWSVDTVPARKRFDLLEDALASWVVRWAAKDADDGGEAT